MFTKKELSYTENTVSSVKASSFSSFYVIQIFTIAELRTELLRTRLCVAYFGEPG